jgi:peptidyl-prolyl cis-trans isomerase C
MKMNRKLTAVITITAVFTGTLAYMQGQEQENKEIGADAGSPKTVESSAKEETAAPVAAQPDWSFLPEIIASYGDKKITRDDFLKNIKNIMAASMPGTGENAINPEIIKSVAPKIASAMIDKEILLGISEESGIKPTPSLVVSEFDEMLKKAPKDEIEAFEKKLSAEKSNLEEYKKNLSENRMMQEDAAIKSWIDTKITPAISVNETEAKKYYDENLNVFSRPETVNASHILIKADSDKAEDIEKAQKKCEQIKADIDAKKITFEQAAEENSTCPSGKRSKGNLGDFARGNMIKEFEDAAFGLKIGEISSPVKTDYGYHLIRSDGRKDKSVEPFEKVKEQISEFLKQRAIGNTVKDILEKKRTELNVKIFLQDKPDTALPLGSKAPSVPSQPAANPEDKK